MDPGQAARPRLPLAPHARLGPLPAVPRVPRALPSPGPVRSLCPDLGPPPHGLRARSACRRCHVSGDSRGVPSGRLAWRSLRRRPSCVPAPSSSSELPIPRRCVSLSLAFPLRPLTEAQTHPPPPALGPGTWHVGGPGQARAAGRPAPCSHVAVLSRSPLPLGMWRGSAHAPWGVCTCPTAHGKCESLSAWNRAPKSTVSRSLSLVGPGHPECWAGRGTQNLGRGLWPPGVSLQRLELPCVGPGVEEGRVAGAPGRGLGPPSRELQT